MQPSHAPFRILALLSLVLPATACRERPAPVEHRPTSVLLITLDTTRIDHLGCYGSKQGLTPNLDRLAGAGVTFVESRTSVPITLPSHASLMTGLDVLGHGLRENGSFFLAEEANTLAEAFSASGYRTGAFVSSFVLDRRFGLAQGFDTFDDEMTEKGPDRWQGHDVGSFERPADLTTKKAIRWLAAGGGREYFLWVHYFDPHAPHRAPAAFRRRQRSDYASEIAFMDAQAGRLIASAREASENPMIVVASDHGESLGEHGITGHGRDVFEPALRTVLIFQGHASFEAGDRVATPSRNANIATTVARLVGLPADFPGRDLFGGSGEAHTGEPLYVETLLPALRFREPEVRGLLDGPWKLIRWTLPSDSPRSTVALHDLESDPGELRNVEAVYPKRVAEMTARLREILAAGANDPTVGQRAHVDRETLDKLRALGYVASDP